MKEKEVAMMIRTIGMDNINNGFYRSLAFVLSNCAEKKDVDIPSELQALLKDSLDNNSELMSLPFIQICELINLNPSTAITRTLERMSAEVNCGS